MPQKIEWQMGRDGLPEIKTDLSSPEAYEGGIMSRATEFVVGRKPNTARFPNIAQAAAQAAAWAAEGGRKPLIYALASDGASALVPEAMWRDALVRACVMLDQGTPPAEVIVDIKLDLTKIGRLGSKTAA